MAYTIEELKSTLSKATEAGDTEAVAKINEELQKLENSQNTESEAVKSTYTVEQLKTAFDKATTAGDIEGAEIINQEIKKLQSSQSNQENNADYAAGGKFGAPITDAEVQTTPKQEATLGEKALGVAETVGTVATGATTGALGSIYGTLKGLAKELLNGKFGTQEAAKRIEKAAQLAGEELTYTPKTEKGKEYTQNIAKAAEPLTSIAPMNLGVTQLAKAAKEVPIPKKGNIIEANQQTIKGAGITPMTTDIIPPATAVGKVAQNIGEKIPLAGTGGKRVSQQAERVQAIKNTMQEFGYTNGDDVVANITEDLIKSRGQEVSKYSTMKKDIFNKIDNSTNSVVDTTKTVSKIDSEINKIKDLGLGENEKAVAVLEDYKTAFQNKNLKQVDEIRKSLGDKLNDEGLTSVKSILEKSASKIYGTLKNDMENHIKTYGERKDFVKWNVANKRLSDSISDLRVTSLKGILNKGDKIPETVNRMLFSKNQSEQNLLFKNLSKKGRDNARIAIINKIMADSGALDEGGISTAKFISNLKRNNIPVETFFKGRDLDKIKGLNKALQLTKQAEVVGVNPQTGVQLLMPVVFTSLGDVAGSTFGGLASGAGIGLLARAYESQGVSNLLIKLGKAPKTQETQIFKLLNDNVNKFFQSENINLQKQGENKNEDNQ